MDIIKQLINLNMSDCILIAEENNTELNRLFVQK